MPDGEPRLPRRHLLKTLAACLSLAVLSGAPAPARAQAGFGDDRVMLQGFYWESYRHGHADLPGYGDRHWYRILLDEAGAIRDGRFDLVWLPPPSFAGDRSAGYNPKEYWRLDNSYGSVEEHRAMLVALLQAGVEPVADIVINHRDGSTRCADFRNPAWDTRAITRDDEGFSNPNCEIYQTPVAQRGAPEEVPDYASPPPGGTTYAYDSFRDLDHTNPQVRRDIIKYLRSLQSLGYRGWRYDMVHGYHARWLALYNRATTPTFSVGEYDWGAQAAQRGWIWNTATSPGRMETASSVFDFSTMFTLKDNKGRYEAWYGPGGRGIGLVGDNTNGQPWRNRAVTFLENHDTGYRTNEDGTPQRDHALDSFANGWEVEQAYAQVLTHPGLPTVYWKHYFDWGPDLRAKIRALVNARKVAGVHAGSEVSLQANAREAGVYAARVAGRNGMLYVRVGGEDAQWQPSASGYADYREYAAGAGWRVWVALPGNPAVQQAATRPALPVPDYRPAAGIEVPDTLVGD
ncbi:alpha-amylase C-terminal beta-sheet domain-containing protein [Paracraurococcus lichenis]|uniref:Alpha-amylase family glycosyl hydrolase n=1 Tax=Paracraurococcus lichenis TaxID=3064888 RepID=A0ABT9E1C7_9PROT|nr:alpha-amylase family glycosyl hydrolase [Paracraurococcus sp. LOR1-02]MDO9709951.1 alpha-amylase family glycosyl hydrolase [Paracraurococcus sp. LOR1-02]